MPDQLTNRTSMMTRQEVADFLKVSARTVDRLRQSDPRFPRCVAVGRGIRWRPEDIRRYATPETPNGKPSTEVH